MKWNKTLATVGLIIMGCCSTVSLAQWIKSPDPDQSTTGTETENEGAYQYDFAVAYGEGGESSVDMAAHPYYIWNGSDESSASATLNSLKKGYKYCGGTPIPYKTFAFTVVIDLEWNVGGDSNNWSPTAGTSSASANLYTKVDSEPDDPDTEPAYDNRWDGSKTESQTITGLGIEVYGISLSWNSGGDVWSDETQGGANSKTWTGSIDNNNGSENVDKVSLTVLSSVSGLANGSNWALEAYSHASNNIVTFTLSPPN
jgi:hypothetical protein